MSSTNNISGDADRFSGDFAEPDLQIITSGGRRIPAHSSVLAAASPVLESVIVRPRKRPTSEKTIRILGVPCDAVSTFVRFLYSSKCDEEQMEKHGIHLLALSHVYLIPHLKQRCTKGLADRLTVENSVDLLQLARLCDAPDLYLKCMKLLSRNFSKAEETEGWKFLQSNDPWLELEIMQFIDEAELRKKRSRRRREEQSLYLQLSEAMMCLEHICQEGCTIVGPSSNMDCASNKKKLPCGKFSTCQGLQLLIRHFAVCKKRVNGNCLRCKRMWQLLRLHSSICDQPEDCGVPLCRQFKLKVQQKRDDPRWKLLVRKVVSAKAMSSLSVPKRKREEEEEPKISMNRPTQMRSFCLPAFTEG